jgi:hypothetical protein
MGIIITKPEYRGTELQDFLTKAFYKKNAVDRFTLLPNVKDKFGMNFLNFDGNVLGASACLFTPNVNALLTEKNLVVDTYQINFEQCVDTFEQSYLADTLRAGANGAQLPATFEAWLMDKLPAKIADELERKAFDELVLEMSTDVNIVPATILPITTLNAIDEIGKVYTSIPAQLFGEEDLVIMMNYNMWKIYQQSAFDTSVPELITDGIKMTYLGIELVPAPIYTLAGGGGLADNVILAGRMSNFVRATDLVSDDSTLKIIDLSETTGDLIIRVTGRLKFKCTYGISEEVVYATV